jgi:hypothetical protein
VTLPSARPRRGRRFSIRATSAHDPALSRSTRSWQTVKRTSMP